MLRVTLEIVPFGNEAHKRTIGEVEIVNDGTGNPSVGNYGATLNLGSSLTGITRVQGFPRRMGALELLRVVLNKAHERDMLEALNNAARAMEDKNEPRTHDESNG